MGKLSKKPGASVKASADNTSGQTKISNFFKNGISQENRPVESTLFQQIGPKDLSETSAIKGDKSRASALKGDKPCVLGSQGTESCAIVEYPSQIVIPETQGFSSPEHLNDDVALVEDGCGNDNLFTPSGTGDENRTNRSPGDYSAIPDTPDPPSNSNRYKGRNRSFLRPTSLLAKMLGHKTSPPKNNLPKNLKVCKSRLSAIGGVSVTFHHIEKKEVNVSKEETPKKDLTDFVSKEIKIVEVDSPKAAIENQIDSRVKMTGSPDYVELLDRESVSRKRSAVQGISPSPKRRSSENSSRPTVNIDFGENASVTCVYSKPVSARVLSISESNVVTPKSNGRRLQRTNDKKVKRLNRYQCTMQREPKTDIIEDNSITCADDDILADILGELHTQISQPSITIATHKSPSVHLQFNKQKRSTSGCCRLNSTEKTTSMSLTEIPKSTISADTFEAESSDAGVSRTTDNFQSEIMKAGNFQANDTDCVSSGTKVENAVSNMENLDDITDDIPDDDSFMAVAGDVLTEGKTESQDLCDEFTNMSPFKLKPGSAELPVYDPTQLRPPADQFGRHKVTDVQYDQSSHKLVLELESHCGQIKRQCHLHGFWCETKVGAGDTVHVLDVEFDGDGIGRVTDTQGLIVVHPDKLISGTSVVSSVQCCRRSVLNEIFKGCDSSNIYMLYGSIIHAFFQEAVQKGIFDKKQLLDLARSVMTQGKFLHEMYSLKVVEDTVQGEIIKYIPPFQSWLQKFTNIGKFALGSQRPESGITVTKVQDIEENIWSPRFGIKGKIDLTVEAKIWQKGPKPEKKIVPLELKTGKASYSIEHKGQVSLYSMMSGDRREDPHQGLLLYLKEGDMQSIPVNGANKAGLVQLRNEMTAYIKHRLHLIGQDGEQRHVIGRLPEPINSKRTCSRCPQLLNCTVFLREVEQCQYDRGHPMSELIPETLAHLSPQHLDYFTRWCLMLELETKAGKQGKNLREIWTLPAIEREKSGECLSGMLLFSSEVIGTGQFNLTFTRHPQHPRYRSLDKTALSLNDTLVISAENKILIALCTGTLVELTGDHIKISSDRDLKTPQNAGLIYRLDKCDIFNTMGSYFTNLSKLMADNPTSANLRKLLIDKEKPLFLPTLSKGAIEKVKTIFKTLNKPQKTAILKVLMCKDYILIKGYPGTGKTSTIVALVKILRLLGYSVLLASYTHSAVDNILLKLKKDGLKFLRLGRVVRIHPAIRPYAAETLVKNITTVAGLQDFYGAQSVVATTCLGSNHVLFSQRRFDVCVVDEASQVLQPACLGPLFSSDRFILVGDPKQLPPVVQSNEARDLGMADSLFSRLDTSGVTYELNLQYRMNSQIMELSNDLIYEGALKCGSDKVANSCLSLPADPTQLKGYFEFLWIHGVLNCEINMAAIFLDTNQVPAPESRDTSGQIRNDAEAELVSVITQVFLKAGVGCDDIGVIAPYRNQVKLIRTCLSSRCHGDIEVNTVDQYQGRDKSVIIISFVKSGGDTTASSGELLKDIHRLYSKLKFGFRTITSGKLNGFCPVLSGELLKDIRRLNVAVTRAKHKLILIGDLPTLEKYEPVMKIISMLQRRDQIIQLPHDAHKAFPR